MFWILSLLKKSILLTNERFFDVSRNFMSKKNFSILISTPYTSNIYFINNETLFNEVTHHRILLTKQTSVRHRVVKPYETRVIKRSTHRILVNTPTSVEHGTDTDPPDSTEVSVQNTYDRQTT